MSSPPLMAIKPLLQVWICYDHTIRVFTVQYKMAVPHDSFPCPPWNLSRSSIWRFPSPTRLSNGARNQQDLQPGDVETLAPTNVLNNLPWTVFHVFQQVLEAWCGCGLKRFEKIDDCGWRRCRGVDVKVNIQHLSRVLTDWFLEWRRYQQGTPWSNGLFDVLRGQLI